MSEGERMDLIWKFFVYMIQGLLLISFNFTVLLAILRDAALRSQYVVLCGLLFTDGLMGCASLVAGTKIFQQFRLLLYSWHPIQWSRALSLNNAIYVHHLHVSKACCILGYGRNQILLSNNLDHLVSRRDCMLKLWNLLFIWVDPMSAIMLMVVSIDRLLLMLCPILYHRKSTCLGVYQLMFAHLYMLGSVCVGWFQSFPDTEREHRPICLSSSAIEHSYFQYHTYLRIISAIASVILYFAVVLLMLSKKKKVQ